MIEKCSPTLSIWLPEAVVGGNSMQSTIVASGTHPYPPHCHTPCKSAPPSSTHATFPSQSEMHQHHPPFSLWLKNEQLDLTSHSIICFIIDKFSFSCISFLHSSLTFLQATLGNICFLSASDNSLIIPPLTSRHPNLPIHTCQCFSSSFPFHTPLLKHLQQPAFIHVTCQYLVPELHVPRSPRQYIKTSSLSSMMPSDVTWPP